MNHAIWVITKLKIAYTKNFKLLKQIYMNDCLTRTENYDWFTQIKNSQKSIRKTCPQKHQLPDRLIDPSTDNMFSVYQFLPKVNRNWQQKNFYK